MPCADNDARMEVREERGRGRGWLGALALLLMIGTCYMPSIQGDFIWDDDSNVSANPTLRTIEGLRRIWSDPHSNQQFYPLTHSSFWVEYRLWGLWPTGFRLTNLLLHALVAILLWRALRRLALPGAWAAAAIFALHPLQVESVAWITERKNLLSSVFYMATFLVYWKWAVADPGRRGRGRYVAALLLFACALLSKSAVVTLPAVLLLLLWWKRGGLRRADIQPVVPMFAMGLAMGIATWILEHGHVGASGAAWKLGFAERLIVASRALWFYATKLILPFELNFIYPRWELAGWHWIFPVAALALPLTLWRRREKIGRGPFVGVAYFGLTLSPALGLIGFYFQIYAFVQDHFQYLACIGLIATAAALAAKHLATRRLRMSQLLLALLLLLLGALTFQRSAIFTDEERLWNATLARNPEAWMAHINLGLLYEAKQRRDEALEQYTLALDDKNLLKDKAHVNIARLMDERGLSAEAERHYRLALEFNPESVEALIGYGNLLTYAERMDEAIASYRRAIEIEPRAVIARYNLAMRLSHRDENTEAELQLREALRQVPYYVDAMDGLGRILSLQDRHEEAVAQYRTVLRYDPSRAEVHYNLAYSLERLEDPKQAEFHYREAIRLQPTLSGSYNNLAIVLYNKGEYAEAWRMVERCVEHGGSPHVGFLAALAEAYPRPRAAE